MHRDEHGEQHFTQKDLEAMVAAAVAFKDAKLAELQSKLGRTQDALRALLARSEAEGWAYSADEREAAVEALK